MNILRRALGWIAEAALVAIFALVLLVFWPFVRRTESELKEDAENDN